MSDSRDYVIVLRDTVTNEWLGVWNGATKTFQNNFPWEYTKAGARSAITKVVSKIVKEEDLEGKTISVEICIRRPAIDE